MKEYILKIIAIIIFLVLCFFLGRSQDSIYIRPFKETQIAPKGVIFLPDTPERAQKIAISKPIKTDTTYLISDLSTMRHIHDKKKPQIKGKVEYFCEVCWKHGKNNCDGCDLCIFYGWNKEYEMGKAPRDPKLFNYWTKQFNRWRDSLGAETGTGSNGVFTITNKGVTRPVNLEREVYQAISGPRTIPPSQMAPNIKPKPIIFVK